MITALDEATAISRLKCGGVVIVPTETSYALMCIATDSAAVARLMAIKHRPSGRPLPLLLPSIATLEHLDPETPLLVLAEAFWPGPLTLVVPAYPGLCAVLTAETNMIGVRVSAHPVAQRIVVAVGQPLVATSANRSGEPAPATVDDCQLAGLLGVDGLVDGGPVAGEASTVMGLVDGQLVMFQPGRLAEARVREVWLKARAG